MAQDQAMKDCIEHCWTCRDTCQRALFTYCLQEGGEHVSPEHVKAMADCIQICQTAADFMTRESEMHAHICRACREICMACEQSCNAIGMDDCAQACRACAESCGAMM